MRTVYEDAEYVCPTCGRPALAVRSSAYWVNVGGALAVLALLLVGTVGLLT